MRAVFLLLLFILSAPAARADVTNVEVLVTYTNQITSRGATTNGDTLTISGDVRRYTNGTLNAVGSWIQSTNVPGWAATNTQIHLATYTPAGIERVFSTNTNAIVIVSLNGVFPTVTLSAGVGTVTYDTNVWSDESILRFPQGALYNEADRTNNVSGLIGLLNDTGGRASNAVMNGILALSNLLDRISVQLATNKTFYLTTNNGGLSDGTRITNFVSLSGSNGTVADVNLHRGSLSNALNITAANFGLSNGTMVGVSNLSGRVGALTNGTHYSNVMVNALVTNSTFGGRVTYFTNGYWTNASFDSIHSTNTFLEGSTMHDDSISNERLNIGWLNDVPYGLAFGSGNTNHFGGSIFGANNYISDGVGLTFGFANWVATNSGDVVIVGSGNQVTNANFVRIFGRENVVTNDHVTMIGNYGRSTEPNQVLFPGGTNSMRVTGRLILDTGATNFQTTANSTNILRGDISFPRSSVTTVANGHNTINIGTNVFVDLTGSPSAAWTWGGITGGNRDGKWIIVRNNTGYPADILDNSGTEPTAALRIDTPTGTNVTLNAAGCALFIYDTSASRWVLLNVFNTDIITASATNAVAYLNGVATNLSVYQTAGTTPALQVFAATGAATNIFSTYSTNGARLLTISSNGLVAYQPPPGLGTNSWSIRHTNGTVNVRVESNSIVAIRPQTGMTNDLMRFETTNGDTAIFVRSNLTLVASNIATTAMGGGQPGLQEIPLGYRFFGITNAVTVTNTTASTSLITNALWGTNWIPGGLVTPGSTVRITAAGYMTSASATPTVFGLRAGNGLMLATNILALPTVLVADFFTIDITLKFRTTGASAVATASGGICYPTTSGGASGMLLRRLQNGPAAWSTITIDTTAPILLDLFTTPGATTHGFTLMDCNAQYIP